MSSCVVSVPDCMSGTRTESALKQRSRFDHSFIGFWKSSYRKRLLIVFGFFAVNIINNAIKQGSTYFPKRQELSQNFRRQKGDVKHKRATFSPLGDVVRSGFVHPCRKITCIFECVCIARC